MDPDPFVSLIGIRIRISLTCIGIAIGIRNRISLISLDRFCRVSNPGVVDHDQDPTLKNNWIRPLIKLINNIYFTEIK